MTQDLREQIIEKLCTCYNDHGSKHLCGAPELADAVLEVLRERIEYAVRTGASTGSLLRLFSQSQSVTHAESEKSEEDKGWEKFVKDCGT